MKLTLKQALMATTLPVVLAANTSAQTAEAPKKETTDLGITSVVGEKKGKNEVSVFKTGTALKDLSRSLSVVTEEQIEEQGIDSIADVIDYTPGVINSQGEGHRDAVVFRGNRSTADFYLDGVRDDVQYYRSLYNLEKVEILRGPSALFFGRGGAGGSLNRVTKKADLNGNFQAYKGSVNTFGATDASLDINHVLSDKAALRLNIFTQQLDNHRDFFDGDRFGINPTLKFQIAPDTTLDLTYEYSDHERFIDRGIPAPTNGTPVRSFSDIVFGDSELNRNEFEGHTFKAVLNHRFSDRWKGSATAAYGNFNKTYTNFFASDVSEDLTQVELDGYTDSTDRNRFTLAGDLVGEFDTGSVAHKVVIGAEFNNTSSDSFRFNNVFASNGDDQQFFNISDFGRLSNGVLRDNSGNIIDSGTFSDLNDRTSVDLTTFSFFFQDEIAVTDKLDVVLGARFDSFDIDVFNADPDADPNDVNNSRKDTNISPKIGLVYKPTDNVSLYASYSESFLPRSGEQFAEINGDDSRLDPDEFSNIEVGVKWNVNNDLLLSASAYQIDQTSFFFDTADSLSQADSEITGFELQLQGRITDYWNVTAGYGYIDASVDSGDNEGNRLRETPEHTFSIWNQFYVNSKLSLGLGVIYQDESFANNDNEARLPSFVRVDASAAYKVSDSLKLQLNIENLFDKEYFPSAHTNNNITVGAPINATFSIKKTF